MISTKFRYYPVFEENGYNRKIIARFTRKEDANEVAIDLGQGYYTMDAEEIPIVIFESVKEFENHDKERKRKEALSNLTKEEIALLGLG